MQSSTRDCCNSSPTRLPFNHCSTVLRAASHKQFLVIRQIHVTHFCLMSLNGLIAQICKVFNLNTVTRKKLIELSWELTIKDETRLMVHLGLQLRIGGGTPNAETELWFLAVKPINDVLRCVLDSINMEWSICFELAHCKAQLVISQIESVIGMKKFLAAEGRVNELANSPHLCFMLAVSCFTFAGMSCGSHFMWWQWVVEFDPLGNFFCEEAIFATKTWMLKEQVNSLVKLFWDVLFLEALKPWIPLLFPFLSLCSEVCWSRWVLS